MKRLLFVMPPSFNKEGTRELQRECEGYGHSEWHRPLRINRVSGLLKVLCPYLRDCKRGLAARQGKP
jgi:hypothetical protein